MSTKIKLYWDYIQSLLDIDGDLWMGLFTAFILVRIIGVFYKHAPLTSAEAATYSTAVAAFAYSNTGKPKGS